MGYQTTESRYYLVETETDASGNLVLADREPHRFEQREDNLYHVAGEGDTWWGLAQRYFDHISGRACGLFWVLLDYQVPPVVDPTLKIRPGTIVAIPPPVVVINEVLGAERTLYQ